MLSWQYQNMHVLQSNAAFEQWGCTALAVHYTCSAYLTVIHAWVACLTSLMHGWHMLGSLPCAAPSHGLQSSPRVDNIALGCTTGIATSPIVLCVSPVVCTGSCCLIANKRLHSARKHMSRLQALQRRLHWQYWPSIAMATSPSRLVLHGDGHLAICCKITHA